MAYVGVGGGKPAIVCTAWSVLVENAVNVNITESVNIKTSVHDL